MEIERTKDLIFRVESSDRRRIDWNRLNTGQGNDAKVQLGDRKYPSWKEEENKNNNK